MKERNYSIDTLKFFCILGVICRHTAPFSGIPGCEYIGIILNTITRTCVPLFFVVTGYFFYHKCSLRYMKKTLKCFFQTLVTWSVIYILVNFFMGKVLNTIPTSWTILDYLSTFNIIDLYYATGIINYHLWYLSAIVIVLPILYWVTKNELLEKAFVVSFVLNVIGVLLPIIINESICIRVRDGLFFGLFYCVLGSCIAKYEYKVKKIEQIQSYKYICILGILFGVTIIERYIYMKKFAVVKGDYFISTIPIVIMIFGICLVKTSIMKNTYINKIGRNTLGIYVVHPLILSITSAILTVFGITGITSNIAWRILYTPTILIISLIIYRILYKFRLIIIRFMKKMQVCKNETNRVHES